MKLEDVTMQDLISKPLFWEDFEEDRADSSTMKAAIEADPRSIEKIRFLDQVEEGKGCKDPEKVKAFIEASLNA